MHELDCKAINGRDFGADESALGSLREVMLALRRRMCSMEGELAAVDDLGAFLQLLKLVELEA